MRWKPQVGLPWLCNACPLPSTIYTKYRIHFPFILTDTCFTSTPFVTTRKEVLSSCEGIQNLLQRERKKNQLLQSFSWERDGQSQAHFRLSCKQLCVQPWFPGKLFFYWLVLSFQVQYCSMSLIHQQSLTNQKASWFQLFFFLKWQDTDYKIGLFCFLKKQLFKGHGNPCLYKLVSEYPSYEIQEIVDKIILKSHLENDVRRKGKGLTNAYCQS